MVRGAKPEDGGLKAAATKAREPRWKRDTVASRTDGVLQGVSRPRFGRSSKPRRWRPKGRGYKSKRIQMETRRRRQPYRWRPASKTRRWRPKGRRYKSKRQADSSLRPE